MKKFLKRDKPLLQKNDVEGFQPKSKSITRPISQPGMDADAIVRSHTETSIDRLLGAEKWSEVKDIFVQEQKYLLQDSALLEIDKKIAEFRAIQNSDSQILQYLQEHRRLIENARESGIENAWDNLQKYIASRNDSAAEDSFRFESLRFHQGQKSQRTFMIIQKFLIAPSWNITFEILRAESKTLLSDFAINILVNFELAAQKNSSLADQAELSYLTEHRELLDFAKKFGVEEAIAVFNEKIQKQRDEQSSQVVIRVNQDELQKIILLIREFLSTQNWSETYAMLKKEQETLLAPVTRYIFQGFIDGQERAEHSERKTVYLRMHLKLLQMAAEIGVEKAWATFTEMMGIHLAGEELDLPAEQTIDDTELAEIQNTIQLARGVLDNFLSVSTWTDAKNIFLQNFDMLTSNFVIAFLSAQADQLQTSGSERDLYAMNILLQEAKLFIRAREIGPEKAWEEFENNLQ